MAIFYIKHFTAHGFYQFCDAFPAVVKFAVEISGQSFALYALYYLYAFHMY